MTRPTLPPGDRCSRLANDNQPPVQRRSFDVATDDLERALRDCLVGQTTCPPQVHDAAGRAIRRARRIRRTRAGGAMALGVCLLATVGVAGGGLLSSPAPTPELLAGPSMSALPTATTSRPVAPAAPLPFSGELPREPLSAIQLSPIDLVVAGKLHTFDGEQVDLAPLDEVTLASRISGGWLLVTGPPTDGAATVWFMTPGTAPTAVLPAVDAVAVDTDGSRIAWSRGTEVAVASVVGGKLTGTTTSPAPEQSRPVGFAGDAVLLARDPAERSRGFSAWWPGQGEFEPSWSEHTSALYGTLPDGRTVVAQISDESGRGCLALLDVRRGLTATRTACALPLAGDGRGAVSIDGRWLVANGVADTRSASESELAMLVDLQRVFDDDTGSAVREAGQRLTGAAVWVDPDTVVHAAGVDQVVLIDVDRISNDKGGGVEQIHLPVPVAPDTRPVLVTGVTDRR